MDTNNLQLIVNSLVNQFGETGAREYISTGDYPFELKALAMSMIRKITINEDSLAMHSDYSDIENPWINDLNQAS